MNMKLDGKTCPVCKAYMFEDEDIVYCPTCGAPHHKDCYLTLTHCAYEASHGTPGQYTDPDDDNHDDDSKNGTETSSGGTHSKAKVSCPACGKEAPADTLFCPYCGIDVTGKKSPPAGSFPLGGMPIGNLLGTYDPYGGVDSDRKIEDFTAKEAVKYIGSNTGYYIPKLISISKEKKTSWNWAAFLFPEGWLLYRKCLLAGFIVLMLMLTANVLSMPMQIQMNDTQSVLSVDATAKEQNEALTASFRNTDIFTLSTFGISIALFLGVRIVMGLFGNYIYKGQVIKDIHNLKDAEKEESPDMDDDIDFDTKLSRKGHPSIMWLLIAFSITSWFPTIILSLLF